MIVGFLGWFGPALAFHVAHRDVLNGDAPENIGARVTGDVEGVAFRGRVTNIRHPIGGTDAPSIMLVKPSAETTIGHLSVECIDTEDEQGPVSLRARVLTSRDGSATRLQIDRDGGLTDADIAEGVRAMTAGERTIATRVLHWQVSDRGITADVDGLAEILTGGTLERVL